LGSVDCAGHRTKAHCLCCREAGPEPRRTTAQIQVTAGKHLEQETTIGALWNAVQRESAAPHILNRPKFSPSLHVFAAALFVLQAGDARPGAFLIVAHGDSYNEYRTPSLNMLAWFGKALPVVNTFSNR
jgi:hypothetical protein